MNTDIPIPLRAYYSVAELVEFAQRIAALYGDDAQVALVLSHGQTQLSALVTPKKNAASRYPRGADFIELFEAAERDAAEWKVSNRTMTAADLGVMA